MPDQRSPYAAYCATLLLLAGVNPKIVSERLGHASVTFTLDTYSHVLPDMQEAATEELKSYSSKVDTILTPFPPFCLFMKKPPELMNPDDYCFLMVDEMGLEPTTP